MLIDFITKMFPFLLPLLFLGCLGTKINSSLDIIKKDATMQVESTVKPTTKAAAAIENTESNSLETRETRIKKIIARMDSINSTLAWKPIKNNLYRNNKGEIGFQIDYNTEVGNTKNYITSFCSTDSLLRLKKVIDTKSFTYLGSTFYKDKKHIYHYFDMAYGGRFSIYSIGDHKTFKAIGDHYAKDKNNIYGERAGILKNIDYKTFTSHKGVGPYAKDKYGYYFWDDLIMTHKEFEKEYKRKSVSLKEFVNLINK